MDNYSDFEQSVSNGNIEGVEFATLAENYGTPCYVYSAKLIHEACRSVKSTVEKLENVRLCYAVKANNNLSILKLINQEELGFDVTTASELKRVLHVGASSSGIIMTGVGKSQHDISCAIQSDVAEIICDSQEELKRIEKISAELKKEVAVGVRVNPVVKAETHPHIATGHKESKFGEFSATVLEMFRQINANPNLKLGSISCHIGSQIHSAEPYIETTKTILELVHELKAEGINIEKIDIGGGFGVGDVTARPEEDVLAQLVVWLSNNVSNLQIGFQPGRRIVARSAILLSKVEYIKKNHLVIDAGMTELMRPALYDAVHGIAYIGGHPAGPGNINVVGPVCESADFIAKGLDLDVQPGELVAIFDCGAYASVMSSSYNGRLRACEVMISEGLDSAIRHRESFEESIAAEEQVKFFI